MSRTLSPKQLAAMQADPNYRAFVESGDSLRVSVLVSMLYLMHSISNAYAEQAIALMEQYDLVHKKIKTTANNLSLSFDSFDKVLFQLVNKQESQNIFCGDYERFQNICDQFMNMEGALKRFANNPIPETPLDYDNNDENTPTD